MLENSRQRQVTLNFLYLYGRVLSLRNHSPLGVRIIYYSSLSFDYFRQSDT